MEITQQIRDFARDRGLEAGRAREEGMRERSEAFRAGGGELYSRG
jgi:phosphomethylpyrimidine synthase